MTRALSRAKDFNHHRRVQNLSYMSSVDAISLGLSHATDSVIAFGHTPYSYNTEENNKNYTSLE
jgi:hypothetical protein